MASENTEDEQKEQCAGEDDQAECKYFLELQEGNKLLKSEFEEKLKLILDLEREKESKETRLGNLISAVDSKLSECVTEDRTKKIVVENEKKWRDELKSARIRRMASVLEYQKQMAELRKQVFSSADLDDAKINLEIEYLMSFYEELNERNKLLQLEIGRLEKRKYCETDVNEIIDSVTVLTKQFKLENDTDQKLNNEIQTQMMVLEKKIREISATD